MKNIILLFGVVLLSGCGVWQDSQNALAKSMAEIRDCKVVDRDENADSNEKCATRVKASYDEKSDEFQISDLNDDINTKDEVYFIEEGIFEEIFEGMYDVETFPLVVNMYYHDGVLLMTNSIKCAGNLYFRDGSKAIVSSKDEQANCQFICFNGNVVQDSEISPKFKEAMNEAAKNNDINLIDKRLREICGG